MISSGGDTSARAWHGADAAAGAGTPSSRRPQPFYNVPGEGALVDSILATLKVGPIEVNNLSSKYAARFNEVVREARETPFAPDKRNDGSFKRWLLACGFEVGPLFARNRALVIPPRLGEDDPAQVADAAVAVEARGARRGRPYRGKHRSDSAALCALAGGSSSGLVAPGHGRGGGRRSARWEVRCSKDPGPAPTEAATVATDAALAEPPVSLAPSPAEVPCTSFALTSCAGPSEGLEVPAEIPACAAEVGPQEDTMLAEDAVAAAEDPVVAAAALAVTEGAGDAWVTVCPAAPPEDDEEASEDFVLVVEGDVWAEAASQEQPQADFVGKVAEEEEQREDAATGSPSSWLGSLGRSLTGFRQRIAGVGTEEDQEPKADSAVEGEAAEGCMARWILEESSPQAGVNLTAR